MNASVHYVDEGSGKTLVLLHGNGESSDYLKEQIDAFKKRFRIIAPDTRGHGLSPRGNTPFTLDQFVADLEELLDGLGIRKVHILGFSDGANIAMLFAMKQPERIRSLVLAGGNIFPEGLEDSVRAQDAIDLAEAVQQGDTSREEMLRLMTDEPQIKPVDLGCICAPALVMAGTQDMVKEEHTRLIAASIPNAQLRFIEGNHFAIYENPKAFNRIVESFYAQIEQQV